MYSHSPIKVISLFKNGFGVGTLGCQAEVMPDPQPRKKSPNASGATDSSCGLRGGASITTAQNQIKIVHWNANGAVSRKLALAHFLIQRKLDICYIQETHLQQELRFSLRGCQAFRHNREGKRKGGILTLIRNYYPAAEIQRSENSETEFLGVEVILPSFNFQIDNVYSPPTDT